MHNLVYLIGRLAYEPELKKSEKSKNHVSIVLAVQRNFKNQDNVYETDFIRCSLWDCIAENTCEYCHKGDLIGVKGRLQVRSYEENNETKYITEVIAERVTFLSSKRVEEQ